MASDPTQYRYHTFISCSHRDKRWGNWLHKSLMAYRVPKRLFGREGVPKRISSFYRDRDEHPGPADLGQDSNEALKQSRYLIIICSPGSAASLKVTEKIKAFKTMGREDRILCMMVDDEKEVSDNSQTELDECLSAAPLYRLGADGKLNTKLKLIADILGVPYDSLKQCDQVRRVRRMQMVTVASLILMGILSFLSVVFYQARNIADQERNTALHRLKENYRHLGHSAFLEENLEHTLLYLNEVRRIDPQDRRIAFELADAWAALNARAESFPGDEQAIRRLHFTADGSGLISQDANGRVRKYNLITSQVQTLSDKFVYYQGGQHYAEATQTIAAYRELADPDKPGFFMRRIDLLDVRGKERPVQIDTDRKEIANLVPERLSISPHGNYLLTEFVWVGQESVTGIWNLTTNPATFLPLILDEPAGNYIWRFSDDETTLFQIRYTGSKFYVARRSVDSGESLGSLEIPYRVEQTAMQGGLAAFGCVDGSLYLYRVGDGQLLWQSGNTHSTTISGLAFSADGKRLLSADSFGKLAIWDVEHLEDGPIWQKEDHDGISSAAVLSRDGRLAAIAHDRTVSVYRVDESQPVLVQSNHETAITALSLSETGERIAVATESGDIKVWTLQDHAPRKVVSRVPHRTRRIERNDNDTYFAYGDDLYGLWPKTGKREKLISGIPYNLTLFARQKLAIDYNYGWLTIVNNNGESPTQQTFNFEADWTGLPFGLLGVLPKERPALFVFAAPGDALHAFDHTGTPLPKSIPLKKIRGNPASIVFNADGSRGAVSFTDNRLLLFSSSAQGVVGGQWHALLSTLHEVRLVDWVGDSALLLKTKSGFVIYNLKRESMTPLAGANLVAGHSTHIDGEAVIVTLDANGTLTLWTRDGTLLSQNRINRKVLASNQLFKGQQAPVAPTLILSSDGRLAAATIGDRAYIWDLASNDLIWRSTALPTGIDKRLEVKDFIDGDRRLVVLANQGSELISLTLGAVLPAVEELDTFLSDRLGLTLSGGRIISTDND